MIKLHIADGLSLPLDAVTQTFSVLAKRGVGKSYLGAVMTEEMIKAGQAVAVVDPIGVFWGLRAAANGVDPGLPIIVMGGDHGDVPLEESSGELVADLFVQERISAVLDLSLLRKGQQVRFMTAFGERLYHRNREPLHLMVDEADAFAPQRPQRGEERMLGAMEDLVRRGRARGIGLTLITQRSAVLNKDVLTQTECLVCLRTIAPQDREAVDAWIRVHGTPEQRAELMASLPSLPIGEAWFWSPAWLDLFKRVKVRQRETFDSSATPKPGMKVRQPKALADVDLAKLRERMAATIERAKADDPRELRADIARLRKQLAEQGQVNERTHIPVQDHLEQIRELTQRSNLEHARGWNDALKEVHRLVSEMSKDPDFREVEPAPAIRHSGVAQKVERAAVNRQVVGSKPAAGGIASQNGDARLNSGERRILTVLAQYPQGRTKVQVAVVTGYAVNGGGFNNYLGALRSRGFIQNAGDLLTIAHAGQEALGSWQPLPTGRALLDHWTARLGKAERAILEVLAESYPESLSKEGLASQAGYEVTGGGFNNALGRLRTLELVCGYGELRASEDLF